jgi:putative transposase
MNSAAEKLARQIPVKQACVALGVSRSSLYRRRRQPTCQASPPATPTEHHRALSQEERRQVLGILHSERFQDSPPRQVWATLLDEGEHYCSVSSMYRILKEQNESRERRNQRTHPTYARPELLATAPNQLWSWDITWLRGPQRLDYYYLYVILDVFSRYTVGWMVAEEESADLAHHLIAQSCRKWAIQPGTLTIHADRGAPMTSKAVGQLMEDLGIAKSHSRPYTSNDNPYSEAQFKTMKYRPDYPDRFENMAGARLWASPFFDWYNHQHRHSSLGLMTPATVHFGLAAQVTEKRAQVLQYAYQRHPERYVKGLPQPPQLPQAVWINPPTPIQPSSDSSLVLAQPTDHLEDGCIPLAASLTSNQNPTIIPTLSSFQESCALISTRPTSLSIHPSPSSTLDQQVLDVPSSLHDLPTPKEDAL